MKKGKCQGKKDQERAADSGPKLALWNVPASNKSYSPENPILIHRDSKEEESC
jgi:hypothetical protein